MLHSDVWLTLRMKFTKTGKKILLLGNSNDQWQFYSPYRQPFRAKAKFVNFPNQDPVLEICWYDSLAVIYLNPLQSELKVTTINYVNWMNPFGLYFGMKYCRFTTSWRFLPNRQKMTLNVRQLIWSKSWVTRTGKLRKGIGEEQLVLRYLNFYIGR